MKSTLRTAVGAFALLSGALVLAGVADARHRHRRFAPVRGYVQAQVPEALAVFASTGRFAAAGDRIVSARAHLSAVAPKTADAPFEVSVPGGHAHAAVRLVGSKPVTATLDDGAAVYRDVQPDVDMVAVHDPERLELAFLVDKLTKAPDLALSFVPPPGGAVRHEPQTDGLLVVDGAGRAKFRVSAPVAIDARGVKRVGRYELHDGVARLALRWEGLTAPVVVDPAITIPDWTIVSDARAPGHKAYDTGGLSRETHAVFDSARGRVIAVRPARSQQPEDTIFQFGDASRGLHEGAVQRIAPTKRPPGLSGITGTPDATAEWLRGYSLASETWQWNGSKWALGESASLPGMIDPALAFDSKRGRAVLYGGAHPGIGCSLDTAFAWVTSNAPFFCRTADAQDVTYELDGDTWIAKRIAGSPPPRVRAGMTYDVSRGVVVMFGGRELDTSDRMRRVEPYGPVFPESFTRGLLADTWTYDGDAWKRVPTASPPPGLESPQLVYDAGRKVVVLVSDPLGIWEFDGTDWIQRLAPGDPALPASLRTRRDAAAFYDATRGRVTLFGGNVARLDACTASDAEIAATTDPVAREALVRSGCFGGFVHDLWEWDGSKLTATAAVAYGGSIGGRAVFRQLTGASPWSATAPVVAAAAPKKATLLPFRYDGRADHFAPRTVLERAHLGAKPSAPTPTVESTSSTSTSFASPLFASVGRSEVFFDPATNSATVIVDASTVLRTDGSAWTSLTSRSSPFDEGPNDFFAATWDTVAKKTVLFDPRSGDTWLFDDLAGWSLVPRGTGAPAAWTVDPAIRVQADLRLPRDQMKYEAGQKLAPVAKQMPKMVFDRARGVTVMAYAGALFELEGTTWRSAPLPSAWTACSAAINLAYDSTRHKTVAFGCTVPATTWEWDGTTWAGPFASPYQANVWRDRGDLVATMWDASTNWKGTLQSVWTHANSAFDAPSLGGVSMLDADGTLRTWDGTAWSAGPQLGEGYACFVSRKDGSAFDASRGLRFLTNTFPWPLDGTTMIGKDLLPLCFFPPAIEDPAHHRILAFRDGPRGMLELPVGTGDTRVWRAATLGNVGELPPWGGPLLTAVHPYPFELMSAEHAYFPTQSDPASRVHQNGSKTGSFDERRVPNLWWPFRVLGDPDAGRVRLLTNRGVLWELGGETLQGLGATCESSLDCAEGECNAEKVCCESVTCGDAVCTTCKGSVAGRCEVLSGGLPEPRGRCGAGECAGTCNGTAGVCAYDALKSCGATASCTGSTLTAGGHCAPNGATCVVPGTAPDCPLGPDGAPDLKALVFVGSTAVPCAPASKVCPGRLPCETDGKTCKSACASRSDCLSKTDACDASTHTCAPDSVATVVSEKRIVLPERTPPPLIDRAQLIATLRDAGVPSDEAGVLQVPLSMGNVSLVFDPSKTPPLKGLQRCVDYITATISLNPAYSVDSAVASARRCESATPWDEKDPGGADCCPEACLSKYFDARKTMSPSPALRAMIRSACYPGTTELSLDAGVGDASGVETGGP